MEVCRASYTVLHRPHILVVCLALTRQGPWLFERAIWPGSRPILRRLYRLSGAISGEAVLKACFDLVFAVLLTASFSPRPSPLQVPSNLIVVRLGARIWLSCLGIAWGIVAAQFAFMKTAAAFYGWRIALGFVEAGTMPGAPLVR